MSDTDESMAALLASQDSLPKEDLATASAAAVLLLVLDFALPGSRSLKEKRQALSGLRQRFGKSTALAVCESGFQNDLRHAQWTFVATAADRRIAERNLAKVEEFAATRVDAQLLHCARFELH